MKIVITKNQKKRLLETISNNEDDFIGKRVMVYYNLHKHTFSISYKSKVILHADYVKLSDVEFRIRQGGKEKVRKEKNKNVHAFVIGDLIEYCQYPCKNIPEEPTDNIVTYDPYKYDSFVYKNTEEPVYKAKEVDLINLKNKVFVINEIKTKVIQESEEEPTKYTYTTLGLFEKGSTKRYYFNNILPVIDPNPIPNKIKIEGGSGDFVFDRKDLVINKESKNIWITKDILESEYPNYKVVKKTEEIGITPKNIRLSLEKAFPENWKEETTIFSPGLRGIHTIGGKVGDSREDWSIMNYFDTKDEIHSLIYLKYFDDKPEGDIVDWMSNLFKNDKEFTKLLVDRQWSSIESGLKLERESVSNFINKLGTGNVTYYPHGSKMDRWNGVDVRVDSLNYQIKPLKSFKEVDGSYIVYTYGMRNYQNKKMVDKLAFSKNDEVLIFDNEDYKVISKNTVVFNQKPEILK